jgi:hypothetical protein
MGWTTGVRLLSGAGSFLFAIASRLALGPTQHPIQWVPGALSLGVKRLGREADLSPSSSASRYTSTPQCIFISWCLIGEGRLQISWTYYYESELCRGAVTVSFLKYLRWQAMHFLQRSTHFSKTCCRPLITSKFLPLSSLYMVGKAKESHGARSGLYGGCSNGVPPISVSVSIATFQSRNADAPLMLLRHPKKGYFKMTVTPISRSGWIVVKIALLAKGGISKKRPSPHLHKVPTLSNNVSP